MCLQNDLSHNQQDYVLVILTGVQLTAGRSWSLLISSLILLRLFDKHHRLEAHGSSQYVANKRSRFQTRKQKGLS
jgi:hypothetical protein